MAAEQGKGGIQQGIAVKEQAAQRESLRQPSLAYVGGVLSSLQSQEPLFQLAQSALLASLANLHTLSEEQMHTVAAQRETSAIVNALGNFEAIDALSLVGGFVDQLHLIGSPINIGDVHAAEYEALITRAVNEEVIRPDWAMVMRRPIDAMIAGLPIGLRMHFADNRQQLMALSGNQIRLAEHMTRIGLGSEVISELSAPSNIDVTSAIRSQFGVQEVYAPGVAISEFDSHRQIRTRIIPAITQEEAAQFLNPSHPLTNWIKAQEQEYGAAAALVIQPHEYYLKGQLIRRIDVTYYYGKNGITKTEIILPIEISTSQTAA